MIFLKWIIFMELNQQTSRSVHRVGKNIIGFSMILLLVCFVNRSVFQFDMMYPEQPTLYLANQAIKHWSDLFAIYLHPKLLHTNIPFFRPSGHFLIYQLITPIVGWHNTQAFFLINMLFLSLTGYFLIR